MMYLIYLKGTVLLQKIVKNLQENQVALLRYIKKNMRN